MSDRTCLDVAAEAILEPVSKRAPSTFSVARAALDAIHPALKDLTPDDVAAIFDYVGWLMVHEPEAQRRMHRVTSHAWEVLTRD